MCCNGLQRSQRQAGWQTRGARLNGLYKRDGGGVTSWTEPDNKPIKVYDAGDIDFTKIPSRGWLLGVSIALTLIRTSFGPGAGTWTSTNSRTSGPPAFANPYFLDRGGIFWR